MKKVLLLGLCLLFAACTYQTDVHSAKATIVNSQPSATYTTSVPYYYAITSGYYSRYYYPGYLFYNPYYRGCY